MTEKILNVETDESALKNTMPVENLAKNSDTSVENNSFSASNEKNDLKSNFSTENLQKLDNFDNDFLEKSVNFESIADRVSDFYVKSEVENNATIDRILSQEEDDALFSRLFPGVNKEYIKNDPKFKLFSKGKSKSASFCAIYADYLSFVKEIRDDESKRHKIAQNNKLSSPGALSSPHGSENDYFSKEQVKKMSKEQIARNYSKIRESQQKW